MTRGKYLDQLKEALTGLNDGRVREIISEIYGHFDEGLDAGMQEEEIAEGLGAPEDVAREYLELYAGDVEKRPEEPEERRGGWDVFSLNPAETPYNESWSFAMDEGGIFEAGLSAVNLVVRSHEEEMITASFSGSRIANENNYPRIEFAKSGNRVVAREVYPEGYEFGIMSFLRGTRLKLRGTLTVTLPKKVEELLAATHSGGQDIRQIGARTVLLNGASGSIRTENIACAGPFTVETHSGGQQHKGFYADNVSFNAASGGIEAEGCTANAAALGTHSGGLRLRGATIHRAATLSATSGGVTMEDITAGSFEARGHSGSMSVERLSVQGSVVFSTTSGGFKLDGLQAASLEYGGHSGSVRMKGLHIGGDVRVDTTSGGITADEIEGGAARFSSHSGSIRIQRGLFSALRANATSGGVSVDMTRTYDAEIESMSGSIDVHVPGDVGFSYDLSTLSGGMKVNHTNTIEEFRDKRTARGSVGSAEKKIRLHTTSGSLTIS